MKWRWAAAVAPVMLLVLCVAGCKREQEDQPGGPAAPTAAPPATSAPTPPAPAPAPGAEPSAIEGSAAAPVESTAVAPAKLEGVLLNPREGVEILLPDGWEQRDPDDGSLVQMVRKQTVENVIVTVTLDYSVAENLSPGTTIDTLRDEFNRNFAEVLADRNYHGVSTEPVTLAGHPALAIVGDLTDESTSYRSKQYVIQQGKTFWYLGVIGPRDSFATVVAPEFEAIAQSLKLPAAQSSSDSSLSSSAPSAAPAAPAAAPQTQSAGSSR